MARSQILVFGWPSFQRVGLFYMIAASPIFVFACASRIRLALIAHVGIRGARVQCGRISLFLHFTDNLTIHLPDPW